MKLGRNLLAGLISSIWSAVLGLAVVPFYLRYLGIEAYGLIGFFVTMQALLGLLDMGLAPTINREVARCSASGAVSEAGKLLHTLAVVYWVVALLIALTIVGSSAWIASSWLQSSALPTDTVAQAVALMGVVVACRFPVGLYQGVLIGAQRMVTSSVISVAMVTLGSLGAVAVLAWLAPTIQAFFIWQACVGLLHIGIVRQAAWRALGGNQGRRFDLVRLNQVWRFSVGMGGVAVLGALLMQLDKILLSRMLSLEDFGRYALAGVVASGLYVVLTPTINVIFPRLSVLVARGSDEELAEFYRSGTRLLSGILFPIAICGAVLSEEVVYLWTGNQALASNSAPMVSLLLMGTAFNGVMHFPYALQLAFGLTKIPLIIVAVLMIVLLPLVIFLTDRYGVVGGGLAWLTLNILYLFFGTWLTHRYLLRGLAWKWLFFDVLCPFGVAATVIVGGWWYGTTGEMVRDVFIVAGLALFSSAGMLIVLFHSKLTWTGCRLKLFK